MLNSNDYYFYDENEEKYPDGAYWKLVYATCEEVKEANIWGYSIRKIILEIQNSELKKAILDKMLEVIKEYGVYGGGRYYLITNELYTKDQIREVILKEIEFFR